VRRTRPGHAGGLALGVLAALAVAEPRVVDRAIRDGQLPPERRAVRVSQGDDVTLRRTADRAVTPHLHGHDLEAGIVPATPTAIRFLARAAGRLPTEMHGPGGAERTLRSLEVHPR
jgi:hypothetical protein